jgi:SAM-dependent methyltransferase
MRDQLVTRKEVKEMFKKLNLKVPKEYDYEDLKAKAKILLDKWSKEFKEIKKLNLKELKSKKSIEIGHSKNKKILEIEDFLKELSYRFVDLEQDYKALLSLNERIATTYDYFIRNLPVEKEADYLLKNCKDKRRLKILKKFKVICSKFDTTPKVNNLDEHLNNNLDEDINNINTGEYWNHVYENEIDNFNLWRKYPKTIKIVADLISIKDIKSVLELGCGYSSIHSFFNNKYLGLDISKTIIKYMIEEYKTKGNRLGFENHNFKYCDILNGLTHECAEYDVVIATEFLEHFKDNELDKIFKNLKPFKYEKCIFVVPDNCLGNDECPEHYQKWNKESFKTFLSKYYKDVKITQYTDEWDTIKLPCLLAECEGWK